jgi:hypothetical protein
MPKTTSTGHKRRFGAAGIINVIASNTLLQLLLASHLASITTATIITQIFNGILGYSIYGRWVFKSRRLFALEYQISYAILMVSLWIINTLGIQLLSSAGIGLSRNLAAATMIIPLAITSFGIQKLLIFRS